MRAVNIGGHQTFQPSKLARDLSTLNVTSIGAAGTFVVRERISDAKLRKEILTHLAFKPEMMICPAAEILALLNEKGFTSPDAGVQQYVTVMNNPLETAQRLPICLPEKGDWQMRVVAIKGRYVLSQRRIGSHLQFYPNEVIEKRFGMACTTRNWATITKICDILGSRS